MSLEELANVSVSTVSRGLEPTRLVPAAVHVITQDDIRRSGARLHSRGAASRPRRPGRAHRRRHVGDRHPRLRRSPGALDARPHRRPRGLLAALRRHLLGSPGHAARRHRSDRGDSRAGRHALGRQRRQRHHQHHHENAASDAAGTWSRPAAASRSADSAAARYGAAAGDAWHYRCTGRRSIARVEFHAGRPRVRRLARSARRASARDWTPPGGRSLTVQGDVYDGRLGERADASRPTRRRSATPVDRDAPLSGGNVLARWAGRSGGCALRAAGLLRPDESRRDAGRARTATPFDVDFQQRSRRWHRHQSSWGAGYRVTSAASPRATPSGVHAGDAHRQAVQRLRPGRDRASPPSGCALTLGIEARAQRLQRLRGAAERAPPLDARRAPHRVVRR